MKILVTGGAGFIGSHFVGASLKAGHRVAVLDKLTYAGRSENLSDLGPDRGFDGLIVGDICDHSDVRRALQSFRPDVLVHMAAETHVGNSITAGREVFLSTNVNGTNVLLNEFLNYWNGRRRPKSFRFIHVSTDEVYGSLRKYEACWTEDSPYKPNNPYAASKAASDHLVRSYWHTWGLPAIITHCSNNYGHWQHPEKVIPIWIGQCLSGAPMTVHGTGQNIRDWVHVDDHCRGLLAALDKGKVGEVYNFGGMCERSNLSIARMVYRSVFGIEPDDACTQHTPDRPGNDLRYGINIGKAYGQLGWEPGPPIEDRMADVVKWYMDNPGYETSFGC
jgi:dTDP-glucose 4,6-dehydratase